MAIDREDEDVLPGLRVGRYGRLVTYLAFALALGAGFGAACIWARWAWFALWVGGLVAFQFLLRVVWQLVIWRSLARSLGRSMERAVEDGDRARTERLFRVLAGTFATTQLARDLVRVNLLAILSEFDDLERLKTLSSRIDLTKLNANLLPLAQNNVAWARARVGDSHGTVAIAEAAVAGWVPGLGERANMISTLGAALHAEGRHAEALERLDEAIAAGGKPRDQACRRYVRGLALAALGREDEARAAHDQAIRDAPRSVWATRASEAIAGMRPFRG